MEKNKVKGSPILLIGGSAGSLEVLIKTLPQLKLLRNFPLVIVLHRKNSEDNLLEDLIAVKTIIPVVETEDKTPIEVGKIYVAPPDYHLMFESSGEVALDISDKVNYSRPSIDVVFESAAAEYGSGVTAILLSGANADGAEGLAAIQASGGITIVQNPDTCEMPFMPQSALNKITPDVIINPENIAEYINNLDARLDF